MNYATALTLPDWATEAQVYSQQVIRFTPVVFKALSKTIAPVIIANIKGFSNHWFESECYWRQRITNFAGITYNPLTASIRAAHAELTSAEAQATYRRIRHITRETAIDALVIGLCGVVAVAQGVEAAQAIYRHSVAFYGKIQAWFNPVPVIVPSVGVAFAATPDEVITAIVKDIRVERYFTAQFDQLDSDILAINAEEIDEAIAQVMIAKLKQARAALALQTEGDRLAREALAFVVDRAVVFAKVKPKPEVSLANAGATAKRTSRAKDSNSKTRNKATKAEPKTSAGKGVATGKR